jgi:hypothetical protein
MLRRQIEKAGAQFERRVDQRRDELALPHPVHRHVDVVAAAGGVESASDVLTARTYQNALDIEK